MKTGKIGRGLYASGTQSRIESNTQSHYKNVVDLFDLAHPFLYGGIQYLLLFLHGFTVDLKQEFLEIF